MFHRFHDRFGTVGVAVAVMALVAALGGTAYAASGALTGKQKKEVEKIAKKYAGTPGAPGAQGPVGAAGPGGKEGSQGNQGISGATGATGATGAPWPAGGTLPEGATETGVWGTAFGTANGWNESAETANGQWSFDISFPIPLAQAPEVIFVKPNEESTAGCPGRGGGTFADEPYEPTVPEAEPGKFCVYEDQFTEAHVTEVIKTYVFNAEGSGEWSEGPGPSPAGGLIQVRCESPGSECVAAGTWAVTGPEQ